mmetsp:Transcript_4213/g.8797  ORF Transcript_4213/g.8797 Transcript_4213/m.8797 type:complete len:155 (+) Transcript_4213:51-515(+)|eukprot:CAMPEP_0194329956 /NCGR_PEP_ID=MMETSP0171-20130528/49961_1 /TAXON_ID=218684 /ORGANISM="Corethron pennatum, Strain L29A3" /LENGTH=154 /DNA_ID=CAMNT_0039090849 /DNA_START=51 /DNA_END=518 /DNA_ORIENTATION=+
MAPLGFRIQTDLGVIAMRFHAAAAPQTTSYIAALIKSGAYNGKTFYRSDFVIQCGLHPAECPVPNLTVNETNLAPKIGNSRGKAAVAHWDTPDCGNSEFFINLQANPHLDEAYGGYCVFAEVADKNSYTTVDKIAKAIASGAQQTIKINSMVVD